MVIEWLKFKVPLELRDQYIRKDAEVWTAAIASHPGFLGKEVWLNSESLTEIVIIIRWASREQWKSFPQERLEQLEFQFTELMGRSCQLIETGEYHLYKIG